MTNRDKQRQGEYVRVGARVRACTQASGLRVKLRLGSTCHHTDVNTDEDVLCLNKAKVNSEMEKGRTWSLALMAFHLRRASGYL